MQKQPQQHFQGSCTLLEFLRIITLCDLLSKVKKSLEIIRFQGF